MFSKLDKNIDYLVNTNLNYIDCNNNINNNSNTTNNANSSYKELESPNLNDDEAVIDSLDINFEDITEKRDVFNEHTIHHKSLLQPTANLKLIKSKSQKTGAVSISPALSSSSSSSTSSSTLSSSSFDSNTSQHEPFNGFHMSNSKKDLNRNIHCVKEKIRRDRIKLSCNELRRLIPSLNGVKTDMASLLETSVLFIQLINSTIPEQVLLNIQNKLETLKLTRYNKLFPAIKQGKHELSTVKGGGKTEFDPFEFNLKQEHAQIQSQPKPAFVNSLSPLNSNYLSHESDSGLLVSPPTQILTKRNTQEQQYTNNFMSKPSKWLSITQQKYSDLYNSRNAYQDNNEFSDQRCFLSVNNNYAECEYYNRINKKPVNVDYNSLLSNTNTNNNYSLGQFENYCQNQLSDLSVPTSSSTMFHPQT